MSGDNMMMRRATVLLVLSASACFSSSKGGSVPDAGAASPEAAPLDAPAAAGPFDATVPMQDAAPDA